MRSAARRDSDGVSAKSIVVVNTPPFFFGVREYVIHQIGFLCKFVAIVIFISSLLYSTNTAALIIIHRNVEEERVCGNRDDHWCLQFRRASV